MKRALVVTAVLATVGLLKDLLQPLTAGHDMFEPSQPR
jgi:hypothetical protein